MDEIRLEKNWPLFAFMTIMLGLFFGCLPVWLVTWPMLHSAATHQSPPNSLTWPTVIFADAIVVSCLLGLFWVAYTYMRVEITRAGVSKPGLRGRTFLRWSEIRAISRRALAVELHGEHASINLNPYYFRHPDRVLEVIRTHLLPEPTQSQ